MRACRPTTSTFRPSRLRRRRAGGPGVEETVRRIAAERGIDFAPMPDAVAAALPGLVDTVELLAGGMDERER
jgi:hypothetical protein